MSAGHSFVQWQRAISGPIQASGHKLNQHKWMSQSRRKLSVPEPLTKGLSIFPVKKEEENNFIGDNVFVGLWMRGKNQCTAGDNDRLGSVAFHISRMAVVKKDSTCSRPCGSSGCTRRKRRHQWIARWIIRMTFKYRYLNPGASSLSKMLSDLFGNKKPRLSRWPA